MINFPAEGGATLVRDGFNSLAGGMDSSQYPDLIGPEYASLGVNISFRNGKPKTRSGFRQVTLIESEDSNLLRNGLFQGGFRYYSYELGRSVLIGVYSGWIIRVDPITGDCEVLNPGDRNDTERWHYFVQASKYLIIQDGLDIPLIWEGTGAAYRSKTGANNPILGGGNASIVNVTGTATVTTNSPHGLVIGDYVQLDGIEIAGYVGQFFVQSVPSPTTFTITVDSTLGNPTDPGNTRIAPQVPVGLMMAYGQGRLFVAASDRKIFYAGDIIYGNELESNILNFTENQYLSEGQGFSLSADQGRITAMCFPSFQDTQTGQGELFVWGEYGCSSFMVSAQRTTWKDIQIQKVVLLESGCTSQGSIINFTNGDIFYRDQFGIRSYRSARGEMQGYGQTPISGEVYRILSNDVPTRLGYVSGTHFNDLMLMTCTPQFEARRVRILSISEAGVVETVDEHGLEIGDTIEIGDTQGLNGAYTVLAASDTQITISIPPGSDLVVNYGSYVVGTGESLGNTGTEIYNLGAVVLDFNSTTTVGGKSFPAWNGVWTGIKFQALTAGYFDTRERCFAFVYGGVGDNQIWEITRDDLSDSYGESYTPIQCVLETRAFNFDTPFNLKALQQLNLWITNLIGDSNFQAFYKTDNRSCWTPWGSSFRRCATVGDIIPETNPNVEGLVQNRPQIRNRITIPTPLATCDTVGGGLLRNGYVVQIRLEWTGNLIVDKLIVSAQNMIEDPKATCPQGPLTPPSE